MKRKGPNHCWIGSDPDFILMALAAPLLAPNDPNATDLALKNAPPSSEYPLGCDQMGRCELSRLLYGSKVLYGADHSGTDRTGRLRAVRGMLFQL